MMRGWRSLLPILVFTALYAAVSLSVTNSYYQLVMTLVPVWAIFGLVAYGPERTFTRPSKLLTVPMM